MKISPNPRYVKAPYELGCIDNDGNIVTENVDPYPARFETEKDAREFMEALLVGVSEANKKFRKLGIPYFLVTRPDGTTYESW